MNFRSVRFRLTLWYSSAFFATCALVFAIFYLVTGQTLYYQTDLSLASHGNQVREVLEKQNLGMQVMPEAPGMLIIIMNSAGTIITSSAASEMDKLTLNKLFQQAKKTENPVYANEIFSSQSLRFWLSPVHSEGKFQGAILVGHPIDIIEKALTSLLLTLVLILAGMAGLAVFGGYFLARGAMEPVKVISARLKHVSSENLQQRVDNPQTGDELEELTETFNNLLDRLRQAFKRERQFIADLAHELKTPLSTLQSSAEIILTKKRSNEEYEKTFRESLVDIRRLAATLKNVLDLAWSDADKAVIAGEKFNLSEEMTELWDVATKMASVKKITVKGIVANDIFIFGKKDKLGRALLNIIDNAVKYTPEKGTITLNLQRKNGRTIVEIKDTGPGIAKEDLPRIFERFYRGAKSNKVIGSGLGLAITQAAVTSHHGKIKVESQPGQGSTFIITLP